jgi:O-antigen ligase
VAAFAAWTLISALASAHPLESLTTAKGLLTLGTLYVLVAALPDARAARRFLAALFAAVSAVAVLSIVQVAVSPPAPPALPVLGHVLRKCSRAHGFYSIYMTLAGVLTLVLVGALPRVARLEREAAWGVPAWLASLLALGLTSVRGAWLGFVVGALGSALALRRRVLVVASLALVIVAVLTAAPPVRERLRTIGDPRDDTTRDRIAMWRGGLRIVRDHPVTGVGVGQMKHAYPLYAPAEALRRSTSHLHNTPLQILAERGVPGLAAWLAIFAAFFGRAVRTLRRLPPGGDAALVLGCTMAVAAFLVAGLFEYNFGDTEVLLVACSLMALALVVEREAAPRPRAGTGRVGEGSGQ